MASIILRKKKIQSYLIQFYKDAVKNSKYFFYITAYLQQDF